MFNNVGKKIKILSVVFFWIGLVFSFIMAVVVISLSLAVPDLHIVFCCA